MGGMPYAKAGSDLSLVGLDPCLSPSSKCAHLVLLVLGFRIGKRIVCLNGEDQLTETSFSKRRHIILNNLELGLIVVRPLAPLYPLCYPGMDTSTIDQEENQKALQIHTSPQ